MKPTKGNNLNSSQVRQVKQEFIYRLTVENETQARLNYARHGFDFPTAKLVTDSEWLAEYAFYFKKDGTLASKPRHCVPAYFVD